jgi:hypothetical protein
MKLFLGTCFAFGEEGTCFVEESTCLAFKGELPPMLPELSICVGKIELTTG